MDKNIDVFLDMYRFCIVMSPLNVTTEQLAKHLKHYIVGNVQCSDNIIDEDVDTLLLYESEHTEHHRLTREIIEGLETGPKRICFIVGIKTKLHELTELCESNIPLIYASFCSTESSISIKQYPLSSLNNNLILTSPDLCNEHTCKVEEENYIDDGRHYNLEEAKVIHFTQPVSLNILLSLIGKVHRQIYIYHTEYSMSRCQALVEEFEQILEQYMSIRLACSLYLVLEEGRLKVQS